MLSQQKTPPKQDELEISVFGPGFGECIVAHLGNDYWVIVDSCVDAKNPTPKSIEYLQSLGKTPADCVQAIVATHWHDDHVAGISATLSSCENAIFCCPQALSSKDFLHLAELYRESPGTLPPGPREIRDAIEIAARRSKERKLNMLRFASADKLLWISSDKSAKIVALSPSDEMSRRATEFMARAYEVAIAGGAALDRLTPNTPNDTAAAIRIEVGDRSVLLGSDLESGKDARLGWSAVLTSPTAQEGKSAVFKVAHHGSKSGHHDDVWSTMLEDQPWSLIAPFRWGRHRLPNATDRARIRGLTNKAYLTAHPDKDAVPTEKRAPKVDAFIAQTTNARRLACGPVGHIRLRISLSNPEDQGTVELFDGALDLAKVA